MSPDEQRVPERIRQAAAMSGLGAYQGSSRPPFRVPWLWVIVPGILLVSGLLNASGLIELELEGRQEGPVNTAASLMGAAIGAVAIGGALYGALRETRLGVHLYEAGFVVVLRRSSTVLRYDSLVAHEARDAKGRTVYRVRTLRQDSWTELPDVRGIGELGPRLVALAR